MNINRSEWENSSVIERPNQTRTRVYGVSIVRVKNRGNLKEK
jgi:hypothetical protein